jgi:predicted dehydrogenase
MINESEIKTAVCVWGSGAWASFTLAVLREIGAKNLLIGGEPTNDQRRSRLTKLARIYQAKLVLDPDEVGWMGSQAVILALPPEHNFRYADHFLRQGLDVFVQKPLASNFDQAQELFENALQRQRILMGGSDMGYRADIVKAKKLIKQGYIGDPQYLHAQFCHLQERAGWRTDVFLDMGEHVISVVRELMGDPVKISAKRHNPSSGQLYFEGPSWSADTRLSWEASRGNAPEIIIEGTRGALHLNTDDWKEIHGYRTSVGASALARLPKLQQWLSDSHEVIRCAGLHSYARKIKDFLNATESRTSEVGFDRDLETFRMLRDAIDVPTPVDVHSHS